MAKKKTTRQDNSTQNGEKTHQSPPSMDDVSEKIESLKSLNAMLLKETVEKRQQVDSLQQSNGSLEVELKSVKMEMNVVEVELGKLGEVNLRGGIERDLMFLCIGGYVNEVFDLFERERCGFDEKFEGLEKEFVRVLKEKSDTEDVIRERDCEIGMLKKNVSDVLGEIEREKVVSSRVVCERDETRRELDGKIEECGLLKKKLVEGEKREGVIQGEVKELRVRCDSLVERNEDKERRLNVALKEKALVERSVMELNKVIDGLKEKIVAIDREKEDVVVERDSKVVKIDELEKDVSRLKDVVLEFQKEVEKLRGTVDVLEKKCCVGEAKEKELGMEIGKLVASLESLNVEKSLVTKNWDEAVKHSDDLKSRVEEISKAKSVLEGTKKKQEGEIAELNMQVANLKDTILSLEEASKAEKEKIKCLESEVGRFKDELGRTRSERDEARKSLKQEKSCTKELTTEITEKEKTIEESNKAMEKIKNQKSSLSEQKKELENSCSVLKRDLTLVEKKHAETKKELDSKQAELEQANGKSEKMLALLKNTMTLISKSKDGNGTVNQVKAGEEVKAYVDAIKDAFISQERAVEESKRKLETVQHAEAAHKKNFWTLLTSATIFAAASVAYAARH